MLDRLQYALGCIATPEEFQSKYAFAAVNNNPLLKSFAMFDNLDLVNGIKNNFQLISRLDKDVNFKLKKLLC
jgi:hypothetical protein